MHMSACPPSRAGTPQAYLALQVEEEDGRRHDAGGYGSGGCQGGGMHYRSMARVVLVIIEFRYGRILELGGDARVIDGQRTRHIH